MSATTTTAVVDPQGGGEVVGEGGVRSQTVTLTGMTDMTALVVTPLAFVLEAKRKKGMKICQEEGWRRHLFAGAELADASAELAEEAAEVVVLRCGADGEGGSCQRCRTQGAGRCLVLGAVSLGDGSMHLVDEVEVPLRRWQRRRGRRCKLGGE